MEFVDLPSTDFDKIYNLTQLSSCSEDRATIVKYFVMYLAAKIQYALSGHAVRFFEDDNKSANIGAVTYDHLIFKAAVKDHLVWLFPGLLVAVAKHFNSIELNKAKEDCPMHTAEYW